MMLLFSQCSRPGRGGHRPERQYCGIPGIHGHRFWGGYGNLQRFLDGKLHHTFNGRRHYHLAVAWLRHRKRGRLRRSERHEVFRRRHRERREYSDADFQRAPGLLWLLVVGRRRREPRFRAVFEQVPCCVLQYRHCPRIAQQCVQRQSEQRPRFRRTVRLSELYRNQRHHDYLGRVHSDHCAAGFEADNFTIDPNALFSTPPGTIISGGVTDHPRAVFSGPAHLAGAIGVTSCCWRRKKAAATIGEAAAQTGMVKTCPKTRGNGSTLIPRLDQSDAALPLRPPLAVLRWVPSRDTPLPDQRLRHFRLRCRTSLARPWADEKSRRSRPSQGSIEA